jgi:dienelactone hydrolase
MRIAFLAFLLVVPLVHAEEPPPSPDADLDRVRAEFRARLELEPSEYEVELGEPREAAGGVTARELRFPSPVTSVDPETNDTVRATFYHGVDPEPAAVIVLAGWGGEPLTPMLARRLAAETKLRVLHVQVPFQEERTPKGRRSGEMTLSADLDHSIEAFRQTVLDVRRATEWLVREQSVDPKRIGLMGTSLGGFVSASLYGMDDRYRCCAAQLAGADVARVLFNGNFLTAPVVAALGAKGIDEEGARKALRPIAPATWARAERKDGILVIAAEKDRIVSLENARDLAKAFGGARLEILEDAGHLAFVELQQVFPKVRDHLVERLAPREEED